MSLVSQTNFNNIITRVIFPQMGHFIPCGPFRHSIQDFWGPVLIEVLFSLTLFPFFCVSRSRWCWRGSGHFCFKFDTSRGSLWSCKKSTSSGLSSDKGTSFYLGSVQLKNIYWSLGRLWNEGSNYQDLIGRAPSRHINYFIGILS